MNEGFPKLENNLEKPHIKDGIDFVFQQHSKLVEIGTKEQYSEYLDSMFPESKYKQLVYHGTKQSERFEEFHSEKMATARNFGKGSYFATHIYKPSIYAGEKGHVVAAVLNIKKPFVTNSRYNDSRGAIYKIPNDLKISEYTDGCDSILNYDNLDRDFLVKFNKYLIKYVGERDTEGLPAYQKNIYTTPEVDEIVVDSPTQIHILGSRSDIQRFKEFVG